MFVNNHLDNTDNNPLKNILEEADDVAPAAGDITKYNPLKSNYHPLNDAGWKAGEKVPYLALARTLELVWVV